MRCFKIVTLLLSCTFLLINFACSRPAPQVPGGLTPAPTPAKPELKAGWEAEWQKTLAEARKEGKIIVYGPPGSDIRKALTEGFQKAYPGIEVEYFGATGAMVAPKVKAEKRAGLNTIDFHIGGTQSILSELMQFATPIEPLLILPEAKDLKYWKDGKLDYADSARKFNVVFAVYGKVAIAYNPTLLEPQKAQEMSYWDLTKPEMKGKVIARDPRTSGPGQTSFLFLYAHSQLGPDLIKALGKNDLVLTRDDRQLLEWISVGKYAVGIGHSDLQLAELRKLGVPNIKTQPVLKEGTYTTGGFSSLMVFEGPPHPSAAKVYLNWLLSKEGQILWTTASSYPSRRADMDDVIAKYADSEAIIKPGVTYINTYNEDSLAVRDKLVPLLTEVFGR